MPDRAIIQRKPSRATATITVALMAAALLISIGSQSALAIGTGFTYQGQLKKSGAPYTGNADLVFSLYSSSAGGLPIATVTLNAQPVAAGLFTVPLDFGSVFDGTARWMEIRTSTNGEPLTTLIPRQEIKSTPYAVRSVFAENGAGGGLALPYAGSGANGVNPVFKVTNTGASGRLIGIRGEALAGNLGWGVEGRGSESGVRGYSDASEGIGVTGNSSQYWGLWGSTSSFLNTVGGVFGFALNGYGVKGQTGDGVGVYGEASEEGHGVRGTSLNGTGMWGTSTNYIGVYGQSTSSYGVYGYSQNWAAVYGLSINDIGVTGESQGSDGVWGKTSAIDRAGVYGSTNQAASFGGIFRNTAGGTALLCDGRADVRSLRILGGADIVEGFDAHDNTDAAGKPEPGTVLVIDEARSGELRTSRAPYDRKVAGVVSGANGISHGMKLGQDGVLDGETLVAMTGRVYVKCSTENGVIRPGDLLTTSATSGHAMRAIDHDRANGAVIGKAMSSLDARTGLVLVLVNLQ